MTDGIKACNSAMAQAFGGEELTHRYYELLHPPKEDKSSEEIISSIKQGLSEL